MAVVFAAWDGLAAPRRISRTQAPAIHIDPELVYTGETPRVLAKPGRVAALALIGVFGVSVLGAFWSANLSEEPSATVTFAPAPAVETTTVRLWAPLLEDESDTTSAATFEQAEEATPEATEAVEAEMTSEPEPERSPEPTPEVVAAANDPTPPPTPEPTPEPPPPPAPAAQMTGASLRETALAVGWPESELDELLSVAWCESRFRPNANGFGALGLMQIIPWWFESLGIDVALAFDPATNLKVAYHIYQNDLRNGYDEWSSWTCKPAGLPPHAP